LKIIAWQGVSTRMFHFPTMQVGYHVHSTISLPNTRAYRKATAQKSGCIRSNLCLDILYPAIGREFPSQGCTSEHLTLYPFHGRIRGIFPSPHVIQPRYIYFY